MYEERQEKVADRGRPSSKQTVGDSDLLPQFSIRSWCSVDKWLVVGCFLLQQSLRHLQRPRTNKLGLPRLKKKFVDLVGWI